MNTPEAIARKWANQWLSKEWLAQESLADLILQAAAEMVRESGAVGAMIALCNDGRTPWAERQENALNRLREIAQHQELTP